MISNTFFKNDLFLPKLFTTYYPLFVNPFLPLIWSTPNPKSAGFLVFSFWVGEARSSKPSLILFAAAAALDLRQRVFPVISFAAFIVETRPMAFSTLPFVFNLRSGSTSGQFQFYYRYTDAFLKCTISKISGLVIRKDKSILALLPNDFFKSWSLVFRYVTLFQLEIDNNLRIIQNVSPMQLKGLAILLLW